MRSAVVILVVAFIALRPSAEDEGSTAETPTETPSVRDSGRDADARRARRRRRRRRRRRARRSIPGPVLTGEEVEEIRVDKGDTVRFRVRSPQDDHVHIHGYDIMKDVKADETTRIFFKATSTASSRSSSRTRRSRSPSYASIPRSVDAPRVTGGSARISSAIRRAAST